MSRINCTCIYVIVNCHIHRHCHTLTHLRQYSNDVRIISFYYKKYFKNIKQTRFSYIYKNSKPTLKKFFVLPASKVPYCISVCLARSSADSIGVNIRSTVRKAARLAVYDEIIISVKNHHTLPTIRPDTDLLERKQASQLSNGMTKQT